MSSLRFRGQNSRFCYAVGALALGLSACGSELGGTSPGGSTGGAPLAAGSASATGGSTIVGAGGSVPGSGGSSSSTGGITTTSGGSGPLPATGGSIGTGGTGSIGEGGTPSGTGGAVAGAGGQVTGGAGPGTGGTAGGGGSTPGGSAQGGQATGGQQGTVTFSRPEGTLANDPQPPSSVDLPKDRWQDGLISPSMQNGHQINQSSAFNGYLLVGGNEEFWIYDVSDPTSPDQLSSFTTPTRTGGEAETHSISYARYGDTFYVVTIAGRGIDTWNVTDAMNPQHVGQINIPGTNYGDYTEAVWGVTWQGQYIYVGATNNGIKVVDASDPSSLDIVAEVPTSQYGNVSAGPLEAIGNVLVVMTPKESGGIATLDISNPTAPERLASFQADTAYIGAFHRRWAFLIGVRAWDVLSDPSNIGSGSSPDGQIGTEGSEYMAFSDDHMFLGHLRTEIGGTPGASKINVANPGQMGIVGRIWGRLNLGDTNDDQFVFPFGNLLVIGDDQAPFPGWVLGVHQADPDTKAPVVDTVIPKDQSTVPITSRIGITFSDTIELATVDAASFIVRPMGGQPLAGRYGLRMGVLNFDPDQDLEPGTSYEVVLPQGGITDLVGNALASEWMSTFTTN